MLAWLEAPGLIRYAGATLRVVLGERQGGSSPRLQARAQQLTAAKVDVVLAPDIEAATWEKFLFISTFSAVGAATRSAIGPLRSLPQTRALLVAAMHEVLALAQSREVQLTTDAVDRALAACATRTEHRFAASACRDASCEAIDKWSTRHSDRSCGTPASRAECLPAVCRYRCVGAEFRTWRRLSRRLRSAG